MSRKDEAIVRDLLPDEVAIEAYFTAKGKPVPHWAKTAVERYWRAVPDNRLPILAIRALRPHLEQQAPPKDLVELFSRLVALYDLQNLKTVNRYGHPQMSPGVAGAFVAIFNQLSELERKYKLEITLNLDGEVADLEDWERILP
jgi:hypothetical protein